MCFATLNSYCVTSAMFLQHHSILWPSSIIIAQICTFNVQFKMQHKMMYRAVETNVRRGWSGCSRNYHSQTGGDTGWETVGDGRARQSWHRPVLFCQFSYSRWWENYLNSTYWWNDAFAQRQHSPPQIFDNFSSDLRNNSCHFLILSSLSSLSNIQLHSLFSY